MKSESRLVPVADFFFLFYIFFVVGFNVTEQLVAEGSVWFLIKIEEVNHAL